MTESVTEYLRKGIITGRFAPGERLNETELALRLNISRPPIRESFRILEKERLIVTIPRKGTHVTELSVKDLEEVYAAREMLECYAIDLLGAKNARTLPAVEEVLSLASKLAPPSVENADEMVDYNLKCFGGYHLELIRCTGNPWLIEFYNSIAFHLARYQCIYLYMPGGVEYSLEAHGSILRLIKNGFFARAKEEMRIHIRTTFEWLRDKISKAGDDATDSRPQRKPAP